MRYTGHDAMLCLQRAGFRLTTIKIESLMDNRRKGMRLAWLAVGFAGPLALAYGGPVTVAHYGGIVLASSTNIRLLPRSRPCRSSRRTGGLLSGLNPSPHSCN